MIRSRQVSQGLTLKLLPHLTTDPSPLFRSEITRSLQDPQMAAGSTITIQGGSRAQEAEGGQAWVQVQVQVQVGRCWWVQVPRLWTRKRAQTG